MDTLRLSGSQAGPPQGRALDSALMQGPIHHHSQNSWGSTIVGLGSEPSLVLALHRLGLCLQSWLVVTRRGMVAAAFCPSRYMVRAAKPKAATRRSRKASVARLLPQMSRLNTASAGLSSHRCPQDVPGQGRAAKVCGYLF